MNLRHILTVLLLASLGAALHAQSTPFTATYDFASVTASSGTTDPTSVPTASNLVFSSFTAVGASANPNASGRFSFTDWTLGGVASNNTYSSHTGSLNTGEYYSVTITPNSGYLLSLTDLTFTVQRSGTGIRTYAVRSDAGSDNFSTNLPGSITSNTNLSVQSGNIFYWNFDATTTAQTGSTVSLSAAAFQNKATSITLRFYGWNAEAAGGTFSIDNVVINGSVSAIPEPSTYAAIFGALALAGVVVHRRRQARR